jgi:hypothetical protein
VIRGTKPWPCADGAARRAGAAKNIGITWKRKH